MSISKAVFSQYVREQRFRELFNEMGWNNDRTVQPVVIENTPYNLQAVGVKCGLKILTCSTQALPDSALRKKLDTQIKKLFYHYLLICIDKLGAQRWIIPVKKSEGRELVFIDYSDHQAPELLFQKVSQLTFSLEQEERLTIVDVSKRVNDVFIVNSEKITKQFYDKFKKEHTSFLKFIKGIKEITDQQWYASLMLNRLMFCYFIQKQGFLDGNKNYLRDKLNACKQKKGKDQFYSFYRNFLLVLFHEGLNDPSQSKKIIEEIGRVPYLNGGLFDVHELERENKQIEIADKAFESLFDFFDQYEWHLDTRQTSTGKDINPDVIGYIFEKYINDRAEMGAYYTKEDITDYISKNCIIPFLFDETKRHYPKAFQPEGELWQRVKNSGTVYIYDAVKKGVELPLPVEIAIGVDTIKPNLIERRKEWNKPAPEEYALPTEIWREVVERRNRYKEIKAKIDNGEIQQINDFITYNMNIRQFAQDVVENTNDPEFLKHFYKALSSVTILDPTCGSGAFLFAAMNILEPLYEVCLFRMENFIADSKKGRHKFFEDTLAEVQSPHHPNREYYIYKSIILRNLYGVDIMKEAVEIAKLRLFLKLMATIEVDYRKKNLGVEPLPDIDFNIRFGNSLIGFATQDQLYRELEETIDGQLVKPLIDENCNKVAMAFNLFKEIQLTQDYEHRDFLPAKNDLLDQLKVLNSDLNKYLHEHYKAIQFSKWEKSHRPFHWFAEFYEIIKSKGGFDVIIGNPPYVEYGTKLKSIYTLKNYTTIDCGNLHAFIAERSLSLTSFKSYIGLIIPLPSISTSRMTSLQNLIKPKLVNEGRNLWVAAFDERPSSLFDGVDQRLIIEILSCKVTNCKLYTTGINRWYASNREILFSGIHYSRQASNSIKLTTSILKLKNACIESEILKKFYSNSELGYSKSDIQTSNVIYYRTAGGRYWKVILDKPSGMKTVSEKAAYFTNLNSYQVVSILSSSLFWWYYSSHYDMFNLKDYMIFGVRASGFSNEILSALTQKGKEYLDDLDTNAEIKIIQSKTKGSVKQKQFVANKSKYILDEIDKILSKHYGFTDEELDFIIHYDIKYRMGKELEGDEV